MKNRLCDIDADWASIPNNQSYGYRSPNNVSLQTGEEFSPAFLRDRSTSRRSPFVDDIQKPDFHAIQHENQHPACEELSVFPRARRRDSNSSTDFSDYLRRKEYDYDMDYRTCMDGSSGYCRELPPCSHHKRIVSEDLDKVNSFGPSIYLLNSPSHSEPGSKGSRILDCSFSGQMKFLCSFGGSILQRPNDGKHRYIGGDTKIISFRKDLGYLELVKKTTAMCNYPHTIKYQLPGEDLDALISVASDEDLHHMIEEYQELERSSHRLRLFLVYSGDVEVQNVSEPRIIKYTDADYWYEVAANGIGETSNNRSKSRDSLEVPYLNGISTLPKDSSTSFPRIENQKGESSILKPMLLTPSVQDFSSPQAPCMSKPSFQHIDPKTCDTRHWENADCHHGYESNIQCITDTPECANSGFLDASAYYQHDFGVMSNSQQSHGPPTLCSHILQHSEDFQSPPLYVCSSYSDAARSVPVAFPLHSEKLVPSPDTFCFVPVPDKNSHPCTRETDFFPESQPWNKDRIPVNFSSKEPALCRIPSSPREGGREKQIIDEKYKILENEGAVSRETPTLDKDFIHWGEETIKLKKSNKSSGDGWEFSLNSPCMEQKNNVQRIRCLPESDVSFRVPASPQQVKECKYSSLSTYSENSPQILEGLPVSHQMSAHMPEAATKNQYVESNLKNHIPNLIDDDMPFLEYHGLIQTVVVEGSKREPQLRPVAFSQNESSSGSYLDVPIVYHATTRVDNVDGEVFATKERLNDPCLSEENEQSNRYSDHVLNAENGTSIMPVKVNNVIAKLPSGVPASLIMPHVNDGQVYVMESPGEETDVESIIYESDDEDAKVDEDEKDASLSDAAIIEMEASMYGLQIIRNIDLEDLHELGSGTFGTVYHGKWRGTDVAIKRIKKSCFAGRSSEQERLTKDFWREAKIISRLHHPNIVAFYGVVPDGPDCTFATVTEYMANGSLRHVLFRRDRSIDRRKKVMIALDAAFGMEYLHLRNIVHFDLKCDNLLVNLGDPQRPVCKVGDFGLSRIKQNTLVSGGVRGTLPWMAPELLDGGSNRVTEKVDVFSFGIAMWEILTGEEPYLHMHCGAIIGGIVNNTLRPKIPERCDPEWRKLMEDCWSHDPSARPSFPEITKRLRVLSTAFQAKKFNRTRR